MKPNKSAVLFLIVVTSVLFTANVLSAQSNPVLFFSDLTWGPNTGWEGSTTKGAAVTVWGENFGSASASSKVTVNGVDIISTNGTYIAEWDAIGPARSLERITFWIPGTAASGSGTISVTVGGVTSNTLPFNVVAGNIYFISASDGSNSYNGLYSTRAGHTGNDGPWKDAYMFNPDNNHLGDIQLVMYIRQGTYTAVDPFDTGGGSALVQLYGPYGGPTKQKALIAYPAEVPTMDIKNCPYGMLYQSDDPGGPNGGGPNNYFTWSKLYITGANQTHPTGAIDTMGIYDRIIGCSIVNFRPTSQLQSGFIWVGGSQYASIYGNYLYNNGYDSMAHQIYIKTQQSGYQSPSDPSPYPYVATQHIDVGWNEFSNAYSNDLHGGQIFISRSSDIPSGVDTKYIYIHDNYFHDGNQDFIWTGDGYQWIDEVYVYNNVFKGGVGWFGILVGDGLKNEYFYNNTFYECGTEQLVFHAQGTGQSHFVNNIFYGSAGQTLLYLEPYKGATMSSDHDLFYNAGGTTIVPSGFNGPTVITNARIGDPRFVTPGSNFHLQSTSPAIDAGMNSTVTQDYDGNPRPQGSGYDIGAFEYASGYTPPPGDTQAPSVPTALSGTAVSSSQINLSWGASTDNIGVTGYRIYRGGIQIGTSVTNSYSNTGLSPSTTYSYTVSAYDAAGNVSGQSTSISVTTLAAVDTTPPVISSIAVSSITYNSATISWTTNENSNTQVEYGLTTGYGSQTVLNSSLVALHSQSLSGLSASTLYHYRVKSRDAAGNLATSGDYTFTTTVTASCTVPSITSQPQNQTIQSGQTANLSVIASGSTPLSYQWYRGASGNTSTPVGTNSGSYTTPALTQTTSYWVRVTNSCGSANSNTATIAMLAPPAAPSLVSPSGKVTTTTPAYVWNAISNATDYQLQVNDPTGMRILQWYTAAACGCASGTGTCSVTPATALNAGACQWWLKAKNTSGEGPWSAGLAFSIPAPGAATLVSPNGTITTATPTYTWNAVSNSTWYQLQVNDHTGNRVMTWYTAAQSGCASGTGTCSVTPTTALNAGACRWWIQTYNSAGNGPWSSPMSFTVDVPAPPPAPTLLSPSGTVSILTPTYTWNAISNATDYQIQVNDPTGMRILQWYTAAACGCASGTGTCSVTPATALNAGACQWWVQAKNAVGIGPWSTGMSFTISLPPPPAATLVSPSGTITTATPTYTWNAVSNSTWYQLQVNDHTGNRVMTWYTAAQSGCASGTGTCSVTPTTALNAGACRWWIQTYNSAGNGPWSSPMSFTVDVPAPPPAPTLLSPSGTITTATPTYTWNAISNATDYQLQVNDPTGMRILQWYTAAACGCASGTGTCSVTPATALNAGACQWWLKAKNTSGEGPWSAGLAFSIPAPGAATLVSPKGTITTATPTYTWNAVSNSTWYQLQVNDPTGNRVMTWYTAAQCGCASGTGTCSVTPTAVLTSGAGRWLIQTNNSAGNGPWSAPMPFTVP